MPSENTKARRFPGFHEIELPDELDGWENAYPDQLLTDHTQRAREYENSQFWIQDPNVGRRPLRPWDSIFLEAMGIGFPQNMSRVLPLPDVLSQDYRVVAGYLYFCLTPVEDEALLAEREPIFLERLEYQRDHLVELYENTWKPHIKSVIEDLRDLEIPEEFPRYVPDEDVKQSRGITDTVTAISAYHRIIEAVHTGHQRHFELMNAAWSSYQALYDFCHDHFPNIPEHAIVEMLPTLEIDLYRADRELADLARLARDLGKPVISILRSDDSPEEKIAQLEGSEAGQEFLQAFNEAKDPWFFMCYSNGFFSQDGSWIDDLEAPFQHLRDKLHRLGEGKSISRDLEAANEERQRIFEEYRSYLTDEADRETFEDLFEQAESIYYFVDDHNFWIEHYLHTVIFQKMNQIGQLLTNHDLLADPDDVFWFNQYEVIELLSELGRTWGQGQGGFVSHRWKERAEERAEMYEAMEEWEIVPAVGRTPDEVTEMLYNIHMGVDTEKVQTWLDEMSGEVDDADDGVITGFGASDGVVEGICRVIRDPSELDQVGEGEILIAPATNPSWSPAFSRIAAAVTNTGGITHHAATVCREYGLPAVVGTEVATKRLQSGDRIRVDGSSGVVEILERAEG